MNTLKTYLQTLGLTLALIGGTYSFAYIFGAKREIEIYKNEIVTRLDTYKDSLYDKALQLDDKEKMRKLIQLANDINYTSQLITGEKNLDSIIQEKLTIEENTQ